MKDKVKNLALVVLVSLVILSFALVSILSKPKEYSVSERRPLTQWPEISWENLASGSYTKQFEQASLDQFMARDSLRQLKNYFALNILGQSSVNDLYLAQGQIGKLEYPLDDLMLERAGQKFRDIYDLYLKNSGVKTYLSVIPDKNYYLAPEAGQLSLDYLDLEHKIRQECPDFTYIRLYDQLSAADYYRTDSHWKQENIIELARYLAGQMGVDLATDFQIKTVKDDFFGVYYGQLLLPVAADQIKQVTGPSLEACRVTSYPQGKPEQGQLYDQSKLDSKDPYEYYLGGNLPYIQIENPGALTDRELIIFRDSFASSLAPILASGYKKISLIDLRYLHPQVIGKLQEFDQQDVLFLYSSLLLNKSTALR